MFVIVAVAGLTGCGGDDDSGDSEGKPEPVDVRVEFIKTPKAPVTLPPRSETAARPYRIRPDGNLVIEQPLAAEAAKMWDIGADIPVKFLDGSAALRSRVRAVADQWSTHANVHFAWVPRDKFAVIKVSFEQEEDASWSYVGRDAIGLALNENAATMNLGWLTDSTDDTEVSRVVLHEFGHVLGLIHEHQSPAGGIQWDKEKAYAHFKESDDWDKATVDRNVFEQASKDTTNFSAFDPDSIMLYSFPASITLNGVGTSSNTALSDTDIRYIGLWYPFPSAAEGQLRTGDDCDAIDFSVTPNSGPADSVSVTLSQANNVRWWKSVAFPTASGYQELEVENGSNASLAIAVSDLDRSQPVKFAKAKFAGVHTGLSYTWDVMPALIGGDLVTMSWSRDRC